MVQILVQILLILGIALGTTLLLLLWLAMDSPSLPANDARAPDAGVSCPHKVDINGDEEVRYISASSFHSGFSDEPRRLPRVKSMFKKSDLKPQDALKAIKFRKELRRNYLTLPIPIAIFILFIYSIGLHNKTNESYLVEHALKSAFVSEGSDVLNENTTMKYKNIGQRDEVYQWLNETLVPNIFGESDYGETGRINSYNRLLGGLRFQSLHSSRSDCSDESFQCQLYPITQNTTAKRTVTDFITSDGNISRVQTQLAKLNDPYDEDFLVTLNDTTRSLILTAAVYNGELNMFAVVTLTIEFRLGGDVITDYSISSIPAAPYSSLWTIFVDILLLVIVLTGLLLDEVQDIRHHLKYGRMHDYFRNYWNIIDIGSIVLVAISYFLWLSVCLGLNENFKEGITMFSKLKYGGDEIKSLDLFEQSFIDLTNLAARMQHFRFVCMITCLVLSVRVLKNFRFQPRLSILTRTIARSLNESCTFMLVFATVYIAYVISGTLLFGAELEDFNSFWHSAVTCFNILFGMFDFESIKAIDYASAVFWFTSYMLIIFLILLNMFLGIVLDAYADIKTDDETTHNSMRKEINAIAEEYWQQWKSQSAPRIPMPLLKQELMKGELGKKAKITEKELMAIFQVPHDVAASTIETLNTYRAPDYTNDLLKKGATKEDIEGLQVRFDALEKKLLDFMSTH